MALLMIDKTMEQGRIEGLAYEFQGYAKEAIETEDLQEGIKFIDKAIEFHIPLTNALNAAIKEITHLYHESETLIQLNHLKSLLPQVTE